MTRIFFAAVLGGSAMFIWTFVAHIVLPLGEAGIREIPNESAVLDALQANIGEQTSLYVFPGLGVGPTPSKEAKAVAMKQMSEKLARHPSGILMYHPAGSRPLVIANLLLTEFGTELVEAFLVLFLLAQTRLTSYGARVGFVLLAGLLAALATNISTGTGMASLRFTPLPTCSSNSSAFSASAWSAHLSSSQGPAPPCPRTAGQLQTAFVSAHRR